ncbi:hypothetical protein WJ972_13320 [Achromobacter insuavis]
MSASVSLPAPGPGSTWRRSAASRSAPAVSCTDHDWLPAGSILASAQLRRWSAAVPGRSST